MDWKTSVLNLNWLESFINILATFAGVIIAFRLDRYIESRNEKREKREQDKKLFKSLTVLLESFEYNKGNLNSLADTLVAGSLKIILPLDLATWDEFKTDIHKYLRNLQLRYDLCEFFMKMSYVVKLQDRYFNYINIVFPQKKNKKGWCNIFSVNC